MKAKNQFCVLFLLVAVYGMLCCLFTYFFVTMLHKDCKKSPKSDLTRPTYHFKANTDVEGEDLLHVHTNNQEHIQRVCDIFDECVGYNNNGWLKKSLNAHDSSQADFYQKVSYEAEYKESWKSEDEDMMENMKIYVYKTDIGMNLQPARVGSYAVERVFVEQLLKSNFLTKDASEANFFFIPTRCSSYILSQSNQFNGIQLAKKITSQIVKEIQTKYPYWERTWGSDHFYICAHQSGGEVGYDMMKNAIALLSNADYRQPYFTPHKDISIPPYIDPKLYQLLQAFKGGSTLHPSTRTNLAFFAGDTKRGRIRGKLWSLWYNDEDIRLFSHKLEPRHQVEMMKTSKFCLVVRGKQAGDESSSLSEALQAGCVPVIINDYYHLPFNHLTQMLVIVREDHLPRLKSTLASIPPSALHNMQRHIALRHRHLTWSHGNQPQPGDAFHYVIEQLWRRRHLTNYNL